MRDEETERKKEPIEMTTEELLDYAIAPELAERLRAIARGDKPDEEDSDGDES